MNQSACQYESDERQWSQWMACAQQGDATAYEALLEALLPVIRCYLRGRFGASSVLDDLTQESLLAVHNARHTYRPERLFRPWMFTVVRHRAIDVLRRTQPDRLEPLAGNEEAGWYLETCEQLLDSQKLLAGLAPDYRNAVILTQYVGFTAAEAAARLKISESALKARLRRGLKMMRTAMIEHD